MKIEVVFDGKKHEFTTNQLNNRHYAAVSYWQTLKHKTVMDCETNAIFEFNPREQRHQVMSSPALYRGLFAQAVIDGIGKKLAEKNTELAGITDDKSPEHDAVKEQIKELRKLMNFYLDSSAMGAIVQHGKEMALTTVQSGQKASIQSYLNFGGTLYRISGDKITPAGDVATSGFVVEHGLKTGVNPEALAPVWEERLKAAYPDEETRKYFQLCMGATLDPMGKRVFFWKGGSNTGKSTLKNILTNVLRPYWGPFGVGDTIKDGHGEGDAGSKSSLMKAALQTCRIKDEIKASATLNLAAIKEATGGAEKEAKYMNQNMSSVYLSGNILLISNDELNTGSLDDPAMKSRFHIVPQPVAVDLARVYKTPGGETLSSSGEVINYISENEAEGVLMWVIEGLRQAMALRGNEDGIRQFAPKEAVAAEADWNRRVIGGDIEDVLAELGLKFGEEEHTTSCIRKNAVVISDLVQIVKRSESSNDYIKNKMGLQRMVEKIEKLAKVRELSHGEGRTKKYITNLYWCNYDIDDDAEPEEYPVGRKIINDLKNSMSLINSQKIKESVMQNSRFDAPHITQKLQERDRQWAQEGLY